ncbi:MAG: sigma-54-dependent Fis family transcriptional regulator [Desulfovibrio sp.]|nr:sigma-54-dependent Fis family transcriptional regulator [Desulfovibrio sp.]
MNHVASNTSLLREMVRLLGPTDPDAPPDAALDALLSGMVGIFVRLSGVSRAAVVLRLPEDEAPRVRAAAPDGEWLRGEALEAVMRPFDQRETDSTPAVAVLPIEETEQGAARGALVARIGDAEAKRAMADAALVLGRAVDLHQALAAERAARAGELVSLRARVSSGFAAIFGPGGCPGLAGLRADVERAAREAGPVLLWGEAGTGKAGLARLIHEMSPRGAKPFVTADAADAGSVFGTAGNGFPGAGAVEDAAGGGVYVADLAGLAGRDGTDAVERLVRLAEDGGFSRIGSDTPRRTRARLILGSGLPPRELLARIPGLAPLLRGGLSRVIGVPALRQRPGDIPILLERAAAVLAGRSGTRPVFSPRAVKALAAYSWPGNDAEVGSLVAEALLSRTGNRLDLGDLPARIFSMAPAAGGDAVRGVRPGTLWELERDRIATVLSRHGWVKTRAARELGLTPRQLGWRMKRYGLAREAEN